MEKVVGRFPPYQLDPYLPSGQFLYKWALLLSTVFSSNQNLSAVKDDLNFNFFYGCNGRIFNVHIPVLDSWTFDSLQNLIPVLLFTVWNRDKYRRGINCFRFEMLVIFKFATTEPSMLLYLFPDFFIPVFSDGHRNATL
jgi:hypothetical protein